MAGPASLLIASGSPPFDLCALTPYVGRDQERARLGEALARRPAVALVEGEGGVGKTRLVNEVIGRLARADDVVLVGRCREGLDFPLAAVIDAMQNLGAVPNAGSLSRVAGVVGRIMPELAGLLPEAPPPLDDVRAERHRLLRGLVEILAALGPTVLVMEDLQWADGGTRAFLDYLLGYLPSNLVMLCTSRPGASENTGGIPAQLARLPEQVFRARIELEPLDQGTTAAFVKAMLGGQEVSAEFATYLWERTAGLPFGIEEVLRLLADQGDLVQADDGWVRGEIGELGVPRGFAAAVEQRLRVLPEAARRVVQAAAVFGIPTDEHVLARMSKLSISRTADGLAAALSAALLTEVAGELDFRHALTRQAVYESVPGPQRRRLHLYAAQVLEGMQPRQWGSLAHQYRAAGDRHQWLRCAEAAADAAIARGDDAAAMGFLEGIVDAGDLAVESRGAVAIKLAEAALSAGKHKQVLDRLEPVLEAPGLLEAQRGELRLILGWLVGRAGDAASEKGYAHRALDELRDHPARLSQALRTLALTNAHATVTQELNWLDEAECLAMEEPDPAVVTAVVFDRAFTMVSSGDPGATETLGALPTEGSTLAESRQLVRGHLNIATAMVATGRYGEAQRHVTRGETLAQRLFERLAEPFDGVRLLLRWARGETDAAEVGARALLESVYAPTAHEGRLVLGCVLLAVGDVAGGERLLQDVVSDAERAGQFAIACWARAELAIHRMSAGDIAAASQLIDEGLAIPRRKQQWTLAAELLTPAVRAMTTAGPHGTTDVAAAEALLREAADGLADRQAPGAVAALGHARGVVAAFRGDTEQAVKLLRAADEAWSTLPRPLQAARARSDGGRLRLDAGDGEGEALLRSALRALSDLGCVREGNQVRSILRGYGLPVHARRGRRGYGADLSPREREVARLASDGRTNREIAETLVVSPRTIENHVASVLRKLGIDSRLGLKGRCWVSASNR